MAQPPEPSIMERVMNQRDINTAVNALLARTRVHREPDLAPEVLEEGLTSVESLSSLLLTLVNGVTELSEQGVNVEYLRNEQNLVVPTALGMSWTVTGAAMTAGYVRLRDRYWRATRIPYHQYRALVEPAIQSMQIRALVDDAPLAHGVARYPNWDDNAWYTLQDGRQDDMTRANVVMSVVSTALHFNCDIRDYGFLCMQNTRVADDAWRNISDETVPRHRLIVRLRAYTLQSIAALNVNAVAGYALAAWVRAYGVGLGVLPDAASLSVPEITFETRQPTRVNHEAVTQFERIYGRPLVALCANIIAMFGLFHLSKDHTYRTNDANMERIGRSYVMTLRTDTNADTITEMLRFQEAIVRTGPHPFGLAQTYWLALAMSRYGMLMLPLAIRTTVTPPPVQRLMIVDAAAKEWDGTPAGRMASEVYAEYLAVIRTEIALIRQNPPSYSGLHALYAEPNVARTSNASNRAVAAMMPCVYGYIANTHVNERQEKDGLGYALSLGNVQREARATTSIWEQMWQRYLDRMDSQGILAFFRGVHQERAGGLAADVVPEGGPPAGEPG